MVPSESLPVPRPGKAMKVTPTFATKHSSKDISLWGGREFRGGENINCPGVEGSDALSFQLMWSDSDSIAGLLYSSPSQSL